MQTTPITLAYADWLSQYEWQCFGTFTTKYPMSMKQARRAMERFCSFLKEKYGDILIFWVAEPFDTKHSYHTHALVQFAKPLGRKMQAALRKAWQIVTKGSGGKENNNTVLKHYDKNLGARYYVSKYLMKKNADHDILF